MDSQDFMISVEKNFLRSKSVLLRKEKVYAHGKDRLEQFYRMGEMEKVPPTQALTGAMAKHITPIMDMAKDPREFTKEQWKEKITDLRNYTFLLEGLLEDMGVY